MSETTPAGWYEDATGNTRWWDGYQWGAYAPPVARPLMNGAAVGGFILGLFALLTCWVAVFGIVIAVAGITFSSVGLWLLRVRQRVTGRGLASTGLVLSIVSAFIFFLLLLTVASGRQ